MMDARNGGGEASSMDAADQSHVDSTRTQDDAQTNAPSKPSSAGSAAPSKATSKNGSTRNSSPATTAQDKTQSAQTANDAPSGQDAVPDSRDASNAASANPAHSSSKDSDENGAAPYGTRSRNRPGRSRPTINYAEDTEMDFEMAAAPTNGNLSDPPSRNSEAAENGQSPGLSAKKGSGPAQSNASWGSSGSNAKDHPANPNLAGTSGSTSANQANASQPTAKRRKNAAAANGNHASTAAPSQTSAKRGSQLAAAAHSARETNMMTFENTRAILKNGVLEADDGQTVAVNGKLLICFFLAAHCHSVAPATSCGFVCEF